MKCQNIGCKYKNLSRNTLSSKVFKKNLKEINLTKVITPFMECNLWSTDFFFDSPNNKTLNINMSLTYMYKIQMGKLFCKIVKGHPKFTLVSYSY